jgi:hypothetical protein
MLYADPVHRIDVKEFVRERLQQAVEACGGMDVFRAEWLVDVDEDVVRSFGELGVL